MVDHKEYVICIPAYGRDYKSSGEVTIAWNNNKDFYMLARGGYVNKSDAEKYNVAVEVRYNKRMRVIVFNEG